MSKTDEIVHCGAPPGVDCAVCASGFDGDSHLVAQCYREGDDGLDAADGRSFVAVCEACADEVDELVATWSHHAEPPVGAAAPIVAAYGETCDDCSFCARASVDRPALAVEYYRVDDRDGRPTSLDHYSLCGNCADVFEEFLSQIRADAPSSSDGTASRSGPV